MLFFFNYIIYSFHYLLIFFTDFFEFGINRNRMGKAENQDKRKQNLYLCECFPHFKTFTNQIV